MDSDNPSSNDVTMSPPSAPSTTATNTLSTTSTITPPSRLHLPQSDVRSPPRLPPRSGSTTPTQQTQNLSPQRSSSLSPRFREHREPGASSSGSSSSSGGSSGVYPSGQSNGVLDSKPSSQLALMLSTALEELDTLKSRYSEEKRRADYWEGLARSFKVVEEAYSTGTGSGSSGSPGHDRSPRVTTNPGQHHSSDHPAAIVELVSSLQQARYSAECARDDEHARRIVITDLWRQLRDYLEVLERHARDAKLAFDRRAVGLDAGEPIDSDRKETTAGGILVETQRPTPSLRDLEGAGFVYDEKGRLVNRSGQPLPAGVEPLFRYRGERPTDTSPFANTAMGPPTLPPFTATSESKSHRKRRSGSVEGSHHGHSGHVHKKSRVNNYLHPPQPIHPPSHPAQPFTLPPNSSSTPTHQNHAILPNHPTHSRRSPPIHIPPPPPPQQHYGESRPTSKGQGQFVPWHPPGQSSSSKQLPPPQQPSYSALNARDLDRDRQERERGRPSSLPRDSRDRPERGRERSRSISSDKSLDDMILDATASSNQQDQPDTSGNQLPPLRYASTSSGGNGSTKRRSSREREEHDREYHQRRSPPPSNHYLPPPGGPKMYTHPPPPPLPPYQGREVFTPGEGRTGDRPAESVIRPGENGQGDPHHPSFSSNHANSHHPHALTAHPTIPNGQSLSSLPASSSLTSSSHATITNSSHPSIQTSPNQQSASISNQSQSQSSLVQPGSYPPTNAQGQRICRQCGQAGRYKDGKCVEKWGPGPHGPGTVCDRCRKKMKRVERRGTIEQAQAVAAAQAQAARQQAAAQARAEAARMVAEAEQRELEERERGRSGVAKGRVVHPAGLARSDTVVVSSVGEGGGGSPGPYHRRVDREREFSPFNGKRTPLTGGSGELAPPRTIVPAPGSSSSYRGSPLPPRSSSLHPSSRRSESRSGSGEDVDADADGDLDDDGDGDPESPEVLGSDAGGERDLTLKGPQRTRSRGGSGGSIESRRSGGSGSSGSVAIGLRREDRGQEDPEAELLEAVDAAEQSVKSE